MKTLIRYSDILTGNIFLYQLFVEKVRTYLLLKNGDKKIRQKNAVKTKNWTDDETALFSEIWVDPINEFNCL